MKKPFQKTQKLLDEIAAASGRMSTDSDYGVLFLGLILHQIYQKAKILGELATSFDNELISIPISGIEDNFAFFPINYPKYQKAFNLPQVPDLKWQVEGELLERFFKENEQFYENKRSLMIITMLRLSQEFADQLDKITDKNHLPFSASVIFLRAMMKLPDSPGDYHVDKLSIPFPVIIKPEERPSFIKKLNKEIVMLPQSRDIFKAIIV
jgi:hypothetical protein